jgi:hypothetical protein
MIFLKLNITNPLWNDRWANIRNWSGKTLWKHKYFEFQIMKDSCLVNIEFNCNFRTDHAGFSLGLGFLGYSADFTFYDSRHWDDDSNTWTEYEKDLL